MERNSSRILLILVISLAFVLALAKESEHEPPRGKSPEKLVQRSRRQNLESDGSKEEKSVMDSGQEEPADMHGEFVAEEKPADQLMSAAMQESPESKEEKTVEEDEDQTQDPVEVFQEIQGDAKNQGLIKTSKRHALLKRRLKFPASSFSELVPLTLLDQFSCHDEAIGFGHEHPAGTLVHEVVCEIRKLWHYLLIAAKNLKAHLHVEAPQHEEATQGFMTLNDFLSGDSISHLLNHSPTLMQDIINSPENLQIVPHVIRSAIPVHGIRQTFSRLKASMQKFLDHLHAIFTRGHGLPCEKQIFHHSAHMSHLREEIVELEGNLMEVFREDMELQHPNGRHGSKTVSETVFERLNNLNVTLYQSLKILKDLMETMQGAYKGFHASGVPETLGLSPKLLPPSIRQSKIYKHLPRGHFVKKLMNSSDEDPCSIFQSIEQYFPPPPQTTVNTEASSSASSSSSSSSGTSLLNLSVPRILPTKVKSSSSASSSSASSGLPFSSSAASSSKLRRPHILPTKVKSSSSSSSASSSSSSTAGVHAPFSHSLPRVVPFSASSSSSSSFVEDKLPSNSHGPLLVPIRGKNAGVSSSAASAQVNPPSSVLRHSAVDSETEGSSVSATIAESPSFSLPLNPPQVQHSGSIRNITGELLSSVILRESANHDALGRLGLPRINYRPATIVLPQIELTPPFFLKGYYNKVGPFAVSTSEGSAASRLHYPPWGRMPNVLTGPIAPFETTSTSSSSGQASGSSSISSSSSDSESRNDLGFQPNPFLAPFPLVREESMSESGSASQAPGPSFISSSSSDSESRNDLGFQPNPFLAPFPLVREESTSESGSASQAPGPSFISSSSSDSESRNDLGFQPDPFLVPRPLLPIGSTSESSSVSQASGPSSLSSSKSTSKSSGRLASRLKDELPILTPFAMLPIESSLQSSSSSQASGPSSVSSSKSTSKSSGRLASRLKDKIPILTPLPLVPLGSTSQSSSASQPSEPSSISSSSSTSKSSGPLASRLKDKFPILRPSPLFPTESTSQSSTTSQASGPSSISSSSSTSQSAGISVPEVSFNPKIPSIHLSPAHPIETSSQSSSSSYAQGSSTPSSFSTSSASSSTTFPSEKTTSQSSSISYTATTVLPESPRKPPKLIHVPLYPTEEVSQSSFSSYSPESSSSSSSSGFAETYGQPSIHGGYGNPFLPNDSPFQTETYSHSGPFGYAPEPSSLSATSSSGGAQFPVSHGIETNGPFVPIHGFSEAGSNSQSGSFSYSPDHSTSSTSSASSSAFDQANYPRVDDGFKSPVVPITALPEPDVHSSYTSDSSASSSASTSYFVTTSTFSPSEGLHSDSSDRGESSQHRGFETKGPFIPIGALPHAIVSSQSEATSSSTSSFPPSGEGYERKSTVGPVVSTAQTAHSQSSSTSQTPSASSSSSSSSQATSSLLPSVGRLLDGPTRFQIVPQDNPSSFSSSSSSSSSSVTPSSPSSSSTSSSSSSSTSTLPASATMLPRRLGNSGLYKHLIPNNQVPHVLPAPSKVLSPLPDAPNPQASVSTNAESFSTSSSSAGSNAAVDSAHPLLSKEASSSSASSSASSSSFASKTTSIPLPLIQASWHSSTTNNFVTPPPQTTVKSSSASASSAQSKSSGLGSQDKATALKFLMQFPREQIVSALGNDGLSPGDAIDIPLKDNTSLFGRVVDAFSPIRFNVHRPHSSRTGLRKGAKVWKLLPKDFRDRECERKLNLLKQQLRYL